MKLNIDMPIHKEELQNFLEGQEKPKYVFLNKKTPLTVIYEVSDFEEIDDVPAYTKGIIKTQEFSKNLAIRVVEEGKQW